jgi:NADPH:quinone reductase
MRGAWYEKQGPAREVLIVGELPDPLPEIAAAHERVEHPVRRGRVVVIL